MKKVFVSQPVAGKTDEEVLNEKERIAKQYKNAYGDKATVINSFIREKPEEGLNAGLWYLGKSLQIMAQADEVFFCKGWKEARGCKIEHACAEAYGIDIIEE